MNYKFKCAECYRLTEKFVATLEGPEGIFDDVIQYCHFCDLGFYVLSNSKVELVEIEKPQCTIKETLSSKTKSHLSNHDLS